jgi:hypothetical protein
MNDHDLDAAQRMFSGDDSAAGKDRSTRRPHRILAGAGGAY